MAGADGHALILGIVIAYEACAQLIDRVNHGGVKPTWDYTMLHAISTSLGAGRVLGLTREQMRDALALATVSNITLLQTRHGELSNWKGSLGRMAAATACSPPCWRGKGSPDPMRRSRARRAG